MDKFSLSTIPDWRTMKIEDFGQDLVLLNEEMLKERAKISDGFITCCNKMVKRAKEIGDVNLLGYSYYYLADAYYLLSTEYRKFNTNLLKAIEYLQACGDMEHLARCYNRPQSWEHRDCP